MSAFITLVTGATGRQGGAVARRLLAEGRPVRAVVHSSAVPPDLAGADVVRADFDDPASLAPLFDGVGSVFGMPPTALGPDAELEVRRGRALIDAAAAAGVEQFVFSTVASTSSAAGGTPAKALIERHLHERIPKPTVLRPVRFMTNYLSASILGVDGIVDGVHRHLFPPDEPAQIVAVEDIAEFAAMAFADPDRFAGRTLELAGDQPTPAEAVAAIAHATGVPLRYEHLADPADPLLAESSRRWREGHRWHADIEALRVIHPGLRTLDDWLLESGAAAIRARHGRL